MVVDHLRIKVEKTEEELMELKAWKVVHENSLPWRTGS